MRAPAEGFNDVKEGDVLEFYETREIERILTSPGDRAPAARTRARQSDRSHGPGYVGILLRRAHFPDNHSLKGSGRELLSSRRSSPLAPRSEVDHHDVWRRLTLACARGHRELQELLTWSGSAGQACDLLVVEREVVTLDD